MKQNFLSVMCGLSLLVVLAVGSGCESPVSAKSIRRNPTPELHSTSMTRDQNLNRAARTDKANLLQIPDDLDMIFMRDRPVRLTEHPIP